MKPETDPITSDERLLWLVWHDFFKGDDLPLSPRAFEPRDGNNPDTDGISLFREECLSDPLDVLRVLNEGKRDFHGVVRICLTWLTEYGFTVKSMPIEKVPGHVVVPELNIGNYKANKSQFIIPIKALCKKARDNIVRHPIVTGH